MSQFIKLKEFSEEPHLWASDSKLPSWQELHREFPHLIEHRSDNCRRLFITHRWDSPEHPDPSGWQKEAIRELGLHYNFADCCFWYDYMSLPQKPRLTSAEENIFELGKLGIRNLVGSCENITLVSSAGQNHAEDVEAAAARGWIIFELLIARSRWNIPLPLYQRDSPRIELGRQRQRDVDHITADIYSIAPTDSACWIEAWFKKQRITCTNGSDIGLLCELLYKELANHEHCGDVQNIDLDVPIEMSYEDIAQFGFLRANGQSTRFRELYLLSYEPVGISRATVVIVSRPPLPEIDTWTAVDPNSSEQMRISPQTMTSPMYPGVLFQLSKDNQMMKASLSEEANHHPLLT